MWWLKTSHKGLQLTFIFEKHLQSSWPLSLQKRACPRSHSISWAWPGLPSRAGYRHGSPEKGEGTELHWSYNLAKAARGMLAGLGEVTRVTGRTEQEARKSKPGKQEEGRNLRPEWVGK